MNPVPLAAQPTCRMVSETTRQVGEFGADAAGSGEAVGAGFPSPWPAWTIVVAAISAVLLIGSRTTPRPSQRRLGVALSDRTIEAGSTGGVLAPVTDRCARIIRRLPSRTVAAGPAAIAAWVDDVARAVGHGRTLRSALGDVRAASGRVDELVEPLRLSIARGATVGRAAHDWAARCESDGSTDGRRMAMVASVIGVTATVGGPVGQPLDRLAAALRQADADLAERSSQAAQARLSVRVLTWVPLIVLGLLVALDGDVRTALSSALGAGLVIGGIALNLLGAWWMRRIIGGGQR